MAITLKRKQRIDVGKRKHVSQMTSAEQNVIWNKLKSVQETDWVIVDHALDRLKEKKINATIQDIISTIYNASIIEYRIVDNKRTRGYDERVILRAKGIVNRYYNLNVVYSVTNKRIITVWINKVTDRHATLDWNIYDANMQVLGA